MTESMTEAQATADWKGREVMSSIETIAVLLRCDGFKGELTVERDDLTFRFRYTEGGQTAEYITQDCVTRLSKTSLTLAKMTQNIGEAIRQQFPVGFWDTMNVFDRIVESTHQGVVIAGQDSDGQMSNAWKQFGGHGECPSSFKRLLELEMLGRDPRELSKCADRVMKQWKAFQGCIAINDFGCAHDLGMNYWECDCSPRGPSK